METYEYRATLLKDGHLSIPPEIKGRLKKDSQFRVLIMIEEDEKWNKAATSDFFKGYSLKDCIYDKL